MGTMRIGVLMRVRNAAATLPSVLASLAAQTRRPERILAIDNGSGDGSADLLTSAGAEIAVWDKPYDAPAVLNHGCGLLADCDLILFISAHTVIDDADGIARMEACFHDPMVSAASVAWDDDPFWGARVDAATLRALKFGSPYSNSLGMVRRSALVRRPFRHFAGRDIMEDYVWAIEEIFTGHAVMRLPVRFRYLRKGSSREVDHTRLVFALGARCGRPVVWRGARSALQRWLRLRLFGGNAEERVLLGERIRGWWTWRSLPGWDTEPLDVGAGKVAAAGPAG